MGHENHENLDLAKISRYMVLDLASFPDLFQIRANEKKKKKKNRSREVASTEHSEGIVLPCPFDKGGFGDLNQFVCSIRYSSFRLTKQLVADTWG